MNAKNSIKICAYAICCLTIFFSNLRAENRIEDKNINIELEKYETFFINNQAGGFSYGGAINAYESTSAGNVALTLGVNIKGEGKIEFASNTASDSGGAISLYSYFKQTLGSANLSLALESSGNGHILFKNNKVTRTGSEGGAIFVQANTYLIRGASSLSSDVLIKTGNGGKIEFLSNSASYGGAIYFKNRLDSLIYPSEATSSEQFNISSGNYGNICFDGNKALFQGGAIFSNKVNIESGVSGNIEFTNNSATYVGNSTYGGAIYGSADIKVGESGNIKFIGNSSTGSGGAIYVMDHGNISIQGGIYSTIRFENNHAATDGGALLARATAKIQVLDSGNIEFINNDANIGGAINATWAFLPAPVEITGGNGAKISFERNLATTSGGAIAVAELGIKIVVGNDGIISFKDNTATSGYAGAINGGKETKISTGNGGSISFEGNIATYGGAINMDGGNLEISVGDNANLKISNNNSTALDKGGAIKMAGGTFTILLGENSTGLIQGNTSGTVGNANSNFLTFAINGQAGSSTIDDTFNVNTQKGAILNMYDSFSITDNGEKNVNKYGDGRWIIHSSSDNSAYRGKTNVYGGTLAMNGKLGDSYHTITVFEGAKLQGSGIIGGKTFINKGATLSPGNSPGIIVFQNLELQGGSILELEYGDCINITETLAFDFSNGEDIYLNLLDFELTENYNFINFSKDINESEIDNFINHIAFLNGYEGGVNYIEGSGFTLNVTSIPEPSTYAIIFGILAIGFVIYLKRK